jgi:hypothetical protein
MRYYLIDEISDMDMERISLFLRDNGKISDLDKIFWINLPEEYLSEIQSGHAGCKPYVFAVELGSCMVKSEFFIRTLKDMRCSCSGYSDLRQSQFIIHFVDEMIRVLEIRT